MPAKINEVITNIQRSLLESMPYWRSFLTHALSCVHIEEMHLTVSSTAKAFLFVSDAASTLLITYPKAGYELLGGKKAAY